MMLIGIDKETAMKMLMNKNEINRVFFKHKEEYLRVTDHKWVFDHKSDYPNTVNFIKAKFYKEVEENN